MFFSLSPAIKEETVEMLGADEHELIFAKLYDASKRANFQIKTTEGQHYQRYLLQQAAGDRGAG